MPEPVAVMQRVEQDLFVPKRHRQLGRQPVGEHTWVPHGDVYGVLPRNPPARLPARSIQDSHVTAFGMAWRERERHSSKQASERASE